MATQDLQSIEDEEHQESEEVLNEEELFRLASRVGDKWRKMISPNLDSIIYTGTYNDILFFLEDCPSSRNQSSRAYQLLAEYKCAYLGGLTETEGGALEGLCKFVKKVSVELTRNSVLYHEETREGLKKAREYLKGEK